MKRRKVLMVIGFLVFMAIVATGAFRVIERRLLELPQLAIAEVDFSAIPDGSYMGKFRRFPVSAEVEVSVEGDSVKGIKLLSHRHGPGHGAEGILDEVILRQSLQVDVISGATYSSVVILKSLETALENLTR